MVLRTLMCGDHKFSSHDWVNELDIIGGVHRGDCEDRVLCPRQGAMAQLVDAANN